jgi:hypothetical protein
VVKRILKRHWGKKLCAKVNRGLGIPPTSGPRTRSSSLAGAHHATVCRAPSGPVLSALRFGEAPPRPVVQTRFRFSSSAQDPPPPSLPPVAHARGLQGPSRGLSTFRLYCGKTARRHTPLDATTRRARGELRPGVWGCGVCLSVA